MEETKNSMNPRYSKYVTCNELDNVQLKTCLF